MFSVPWPLHTTQTLGAPLETCSSWTLALAGPGAVTNTPRPDLSDHRATDQDQDTEYWTLYTAALCAPDTVQIYYLCKQPPLATKSYNHTDSWSGAYQSHC